MTIKQAIKNILFVECVERPHTASLKQSGKVDLPLLKSKLKELDSPLFRHYDFTIQPISTYEYDSDYKEARWSVLITFKLGLKNRLNMRAEIFIKEQPTYELICNKIRFEIEEELFDTYIEHGLYK